MALLLARVLLATVFAIASVAKFADRAGSREAMSRFGWPPRMVRPLAWALPLLEFLVSLSLLWGPASRAGALGALILLLVFNAAIIINLTRGRSFECRCFGALSSNRIGWPATIRNSLLAVLAGFITADGALPLVFAGLVVAATGLWLGLTMKPGGTLRKDTSAPSFVLPDGAGKDRTLGDLLSKRRSLLLLFSSSACPACDALLPEIKGWQSIEEIEVAVVMVGGDSQEDRLSKTRQHGLARLLLDKDGAVTAAYGVSGTPSAVLIDHQGQIAAPFALGADEIRNLVARALNSKSKARFGRRWMLSRATTLGMGITASLPWLAAACGTPNRQAQAPKAVAAGRGWVCGQRYALCTSAICEPSPNNPKIVNCRCKVENGYSFGFTSCEQRAPNEAALTSTFSFQDVTSRSHFMSCPAGTRWANCLDMPCRIDPANPTQAICQCQLEQGQQVLTLGGDCNTKTCASVIWSAAPANLPGNDQYYAAMKQLGISVTVPPACPNH